MPVAELYVGGGAVGNPAAGWLVVVPVGGVPVVLELAGVLGTDVRGGFGTVPTVGLGGMTLASAVCSSFSASSSCLLSASRLN